MFKLGLALDQATATNELYSSTGSSSSHNNGMEGEFTSSSARFSVFGLKKCNCNSDSETCFQAKNTH